MARRKKRKRRTTKRRSTATTKPVPLPPAHTLEAVLTKALLTDLQSLDRMVSGDMVESGVRRIGAEQEVFLIDGAWRPAPLATQVLERLPEEDGFTTELARFNLEVNLDPLVLEGRCLSTLQADIESKVDRIRTAARELGADVILTGILPTLTKSDLTCDERPTP